MIEVLAADLQELVSAARIARDRAYAPYSGFCVGASVRGESGRIYPGCNVENASYGATLCAERSAIAAMVSNGETRLDALAVFTLADVLSYPCGLCRQVLIEFGTDVRVIVANPAHSKQTTLSELLPAPFVLVR